MPNASTHGHPKIGIASADQSSVASHPIQAILSLGSSEGDRAGWLAFARDRLAEHSQIRLTGISPVIETDPIGAPAAYRSQKYLNQVLVAETTLSADALSSLIHRIEADAGRKRGPIRNMPRTLDIDLIAFGDRIQQDPALTLPHPRAKARRFVLEPLAALLPDYTFPDDPSTTVSQLLARLTNI